MDIIKYSEEHRIFRDSVRKYLEKEVTPHVEAWEEAGHCARVAPGKAWASRGFSACRFRKNTAVSAPIFCIPSS